MIVLHISITIIIKFVNFAGGDKILRAPIKE